MVLKLKIAFNGDVRRLGTAVTRDFASLCAEALEAHEIPLQDRTNMVLKYIDDEGDYVTLSSTGDFEEALALARDERRKSLKLFVFDEGEVAGDHLDFAFDGGASVADGSADGSGVASASESVLSPSVVQKETVTEQTPQEKEPQKPSRSRCGLRRKLFGFLRDANVQAELPDAVLVWFAALREALNTAAAANPTANEGAANDIAKGAVIKAFDTVFERFEAIGSSELVKRARRRTERLAEKAAPFVPSIVSLDENRVVEHVRKIIEMVNARLSGESDNESFFDVLRFGRRHRKRFGGRIHHGFGVGHDFGGGHHHKGHVVGGGHRHHGFGGVHSDDAHGFRGKHRHHGHGFGGKHRHHGFGGGHRHYGHGFGGGNHRHEFGCRHNNHGFGGKHRIHDHGFGYGRRHGFGGRRQEFGGRHRGFGGRHRGFGGRRGRWWRNVIKQQQHGARDPIATVFGSGTTNAASATGATPFDPRAFEQMIGAMFGGGRSGGRCGGSGRYGGGRRGGRRGGRCGKKGQRCPYNAEVVNAKDSDATESMDCRRRRRHRRREAKRITLDDASYTLKLKYTGEVEWPAGTRVVHTRRDYIGAMEIALPSAKPGESVGVMIPLSVAKLTVGKRYHSVYRVKLPADSRCPPPRKFGDPVHIRVEVVGADAGAAKANADELEMANLCKDEFTPADGELAEKLRRLADLGFPLESLNEWCLREGAGNVREAALKLVQLYGGSTK